jgi:hypothetical protein
MLLASGPAATAAGEASKRQGRDAGHFDDERDVDELWNEEVAEPVGASWPLLEVNTAQTVDVSAVWLSFGTPVPRVALDGPESRRRLPIRVAPCAGTVTTAVRAGLPDPRTAERHEP